ncbi:hypothetical protein GCM10022267_85150 [Lentzea roselyniae]|uniref:Secreted protein n=1 Tax=Lentzea roselyniae TaxID=531940 RepID=A0ABP7CDS3_9PSEU
MAAPVTVGVVVRVVGRVPSRLTLVVMTIVHAMQVTIVQVVGVVAVRHGDVTTAVAVGVLVRGVFNVSGRHGNRLLSPDAACRSGRHNRQPSGYHARTHEMPTPATVTVPR